MRKLTERKSMPLLGSYRRLENLVQWSSKKQRGAVSVRNEPIGLTLRSVADEDTPRIYLHWNQFRFSTFLQQTAPRLDHFHCATHGVSINYRKGHTTVKLVVAGRRPLLWDSKVNFEVEPSNIDWLCGMLSFAEEPVFYTSKEAQQVSEIAAPVAIISDQRVGTVSQPQSVSKLLGKRTTSTVDWMLKDVILTEISNQKRIQK